MKRWLATALPADTAYGAFYSEQPPGGVRFASYSGKFQSAKVDRLQYLGNAKASIDSLAQSDPGSTYTQHYGYLGVVEGVAVVVKRTVQC